MFCSSFHLPSKAFCKQRYTCPLIGRQRPTKGSAHSNDRSSLIIRIIIVVNIKSQNKYLEHILLIGAHLFSLWSNDIDPPRLSQQLLRVFLVGWSRYRLRRNMCQDSNCYVMLFGQIRKVQLFSMFNKRIFSIHLLDKFGLMFPLWQLVTLTIPLLIFKFIDIIIIFISPFFILLSSMKVSLWLWWFGTLCEWL